MCYCNGSSELLPSIAEEGTLAQPQGEARSAGRRCVLAWRSAAGQRSLVVHTSGQIAPCWRSGLVGGASAECAARQAAPASVVPASNDWATPSCPQQPQSDVCHCRCRCHCPLLPAAPHYGRAPTTAACCQARPITLSPEQHPLSCEAADKAALRAAAPPAWLALPLPVQVRILACLAPGDLLKLVSVSKQLARLVLSVMQELRVSLKPSSGATGGAPTADKEPAAPARRPAGQQLSHGVLARLIKVPPAGVTVQATINTSAASLAPWLAKYGQRLQRLVLVAGASGAADVDAVLAALLACAEGASRVPQGPVQRILRSLTWPPTSPAGGGGCVGGTAAAQASASSAALLACFQPPPSASQLPAALRLAGGGLVLQHLELHVQCLAHSTVAKLAALSKYAPFLKVVLVCEAAEGPHDRRP